MERLNLGLRASAKALSGLVLVLLTACAASDAGVNPVPGGGGGAGEVAGDAGGARAAGGASSGGPGASGAAVGGSSSPGDGGSAQGGSVQAGASGSSVAGGAAGLAGFSGESSAVGGAAGSVSGGGASGGGASGGGGQLSPSFSTMWSATVIATPSQQLMTASGSNTYRTYFRTRAAGKFNWAFWISNGVDSTYGGGQANPNKVGGTWKIEAAYVADSGTTHNGAVQRGTAVQVKFGGATSRLVNPGDKFWSDPVSLELPAGHDLAFTWTLSGTGYPFVSASFITTYTAAGKSVANQEDATGFSAQRDPLVAPQLIAYDRTVAKRLCFLGDSITQGVGSGRDTYGYWVARIGATLSPDIGIWNLGSGWARAADAASDGYWLYKAKQCDEVAVILGVNDLQSSSRTSTQVLGDLTNIIGKLKRNNAATKIILFTVPTFSLTGTQLTNWRATNASIRSNPPTGVDRVFDVASVLSEPAPNDGQVQAQYHGGDAHPNDAGSSAIANAFLAWYGR